MLIQLHLPVKEINQAKRLRAHCKPGQQIYILAYLCTNISKDSIKIDVSHFVLLFVNLFLLLFLDNNEAQAQPIQISVNHPFMFFIVDRDLDVAVMAGRILNPLNVRIQ